MKATVLAVTALVVLAFLVSPIMAANADNGLYTSKYAATSNEGSKLGYMNGALRAHEGLMSKGLNMTEVATGIVTPIEIRMDGTFGANDLTPGQYLLTLTDGNGGQPETSSFTVVAGYEAVLDKQLLGHAVSQDLAPEAIPEDIVLVEDATYGMQRVVIDVAFVPGVAEVNHTVHHAAVANTYVYVGLFRGDYAKVGCCYKFVNYNLGSYDKVPGHAAYDEIIVDAPAIPEIPEVSHIEGAYVDVKAEVIEAITGGDRTFVFNNAMNPGGIVNVAQDEVIVAIEDPAYGLVKSVVIHVTVNGVAKTIDTMEYETIII